MKLDTRRKNIFAIHQKNGNEISEEFDGYLFIDKRVDSKVKEAVEEIEEQYDIRQKKRVLPY